MSSFNYFIKFFIHFPERSLGIVAATLKGSSKHTIRYTKIIGNLKYTAPKNDNGTPIHQTATNSVTIA